MGETNEKRRILDKLLKKKFKSMKCVGISLGIFALLWAIVFTIDGTRDKTINNKYSSLEGRVDLNVSSIGEETEEVKKDFDKIYKWINGLSITKETSWVYFSEQNLDVKTGSYYSTLYTDECGINMLGIEITQGKFPQGENEVLINENLCSDYGYEDNIVGKTIQMAINGKMRDVTITGIYSNSLNGYENRICNIDKCNKDEEYGSSSLLVDFIDCTEKNIVGINERINKINPSITSCFNNYNQITDETKTVIFSELLIWFKTIFLDNMITIIVITATMIIAACIAEYYYKRITNENNIYRLYGAVDQIKKYFIFRYSLTVIGCIALGFVTGNAIGAVIVKYKLRYLFSEKYIETSIPWIGELIWIVALLFGILFCICNMYKSKKITVRRREKIEDNTQGENDSIKERRCLYIITSAICSALLLYVAYGYFNEFAWNDYVIDDEYRVMDCDYEKYIDIVGNSKDEVNKVIREIEEKVKSYGGETCTVSTGTLIDGTIVNKFKDSDNTEEVNLGEETVEEKDISFYTAAIGCSDKFIGDTLEQNGIEPFKLKDGEAICISAIESISTTDGEYAQIMEGDTLEANFLLNIDNNESEEIKEEIKVVAKGARCDIASFFGDSVLLVNMNTVEKYDDLIPKSYSGGKLDRAYNIGRQIYINGINNREWSEIKDEFYKEDYVFAKIRKNNGAEYNLFYIVTNTLRIIMIVCTYILVTAIWFVGYIKRVHKRKIGDAIEFFVTMEGVLLFISDVVMIVNRIMIIMYTSEQVSFDLIWKVLITFSIINVVIASVILYRQRKNESCSDKKINKVTIIFSVLIIVSVVYVGWEIYDSIYEVGDCRVDYSEHSYNESEDNKQAMLDIYIDIKHSAAVSYSLSDSICELIRGFNQDGFSVNSVMGIGSSDIEDDGSNYIYFDEEGYYTPGIEEISKEYTLEDIFKKKKEQINIVLDVDLDKYSKKEILEIVSSEKLKLEVKMYQYSEYAESVDNITININMNKLNIDVN